MIEGFNTYLIQHHNISDRQLCEIIKLKQQYWHHEAEEHLAWIQENLTNGDYHLLLKSANTLIGYLNLVHIKVLIDDNLMVQMIGVGNVCINKIFLHQKLGLLLMNICKFYLYNLNKDGILLCKSHLIDFYTKAGWNIYQGEKKHNNKELPNYLFLSGNKFISNKKIELGILF